MWRVAIITAVLGCGDNLPGRQTPGGDTGMDAPSNELRHCSDIAAELTGPPGDGLPCDLLPPGFSS